MYLGYCIWDKMMLTGSIGFAGSVHTTMISVSFVLDDIHRDKLKKGAVTFTVTAPLQYYSMAAARAQKITITTMATAISIMSVLMNLFTPPKSFIS